MKYPFMTKTSFLALCVSLLTPCYLLAGGGEDEKSKEGRPSRAVAAPAQNLSTANQGTVGADEEKQGEMAAVTSATSGGLDGLPPYDPSMASGFTVVLEQRDDEAFASKDSKFDGDSESDDDDEIRELKRQAKEQESASRRAAKKRVLLEKIVELKAQENEDIIAATEALEAHSADAQTKAAVVDATRQEIAQVEDELAEVNGSQGASAQPTWEKRQWTKFSDEWSRKKAERQAAGHSGFSTEQKIQKETERVAKQVVQFVKKPFGKKKK